MTILRNCKIVDVVNGEIQEGCLTTRETKIVSIGDEKDQGEAFVDLAGAFLLPGLINCHVHLDLVFPFSSFDPDESVAITSLRCLRRGVEALQAGITTVRSQATYERADIHLRTMIQGGWVEGPRLVSAGRGISVSGGHRSGMGAVVADGADDFLRKARAEIAAGANHLKIYLSSGGEGADSATSGSMMTREEIKAVVSAARSKGTYVSAHSEDPESIREAAGIGVTSFEHGYVLDHDTARTMRTKGCFLCPTLCVTRSADWMRQNKFEPWRIEKALASGQGHLESTRVAIQEGVRIITGTDIPPGDSERGVNITVRELEYLVEAGLTPLGSIQAASTNAAELMGIADEVGRLEPGYVADIIAVDENPLENISALRKIFFVMQKGRTIRYNRP